MIALVDCNNFYASCERVFRPDLNGKPVVVLSNNDGCIISRSDEAKTLGIPMAAAAFQYEKIFEENNIHVFSSNYALYADMSSRVMNILSASVPEIEIYSIDEAFLRFDGFNNIDLREYGTTLKRKVQKYTGIPISIGIAETKALSKVANKISKKFAEQTGGVYVINSEEKRIKALKWLKIGDVWGIGRQHSQKLAYYGVKTAYDFTQLSDSFVRREFTVVGLRLKRDLEGKRTLELEAPENKKAIAVTRTFDRMITDFESLKERICTYAVSCGEKLRYQNSHCNMITVFIRTNQFRDDLAQYNRSMTIHTPTPTNSSIDLINQVSIALKAIYKQGLNYKRAGVMVSGFTPADARQLNLFIKEDTRHAALMKCIDRINASVGEQKVKFAAQSLDRTWKMKQEKLSLRYTTQFNEIISVNARLKNPTTN